MLRDALTLGEPAGALGATRADLPMAATSTLLEPGLAAVRPARALALALALAPAMVRAPAMALTLVPARAPISVPVWLPVRAWFRVPGMLRAIRAGRSGAGWWRAPARPRYVSSRPRSACTWRRSHNSSPPTSNLGQQHHAAPEQPPAHAFGGPSTQSEPEPEFDTPFHLCCAAGHIGPGLHQPDPGAATKPAFLPGDLTAGEFILSWPRRLTDNVHFPVVQPDGYGYFNVPPN